MARDANGRFIKGSGGGGAKITDKDNGFKALVQRMAAAAAGARLSVGIHEAAGDQPSEDGNATVLEVATFNEFGGPPTESKPEGNPPRRSFLADWADEHVDENKETMRKIAVAVVKGKIPNIATGYERAGLLFVGQIQERIRANIAPENAESTIEQKGSSTPLINGGQLWQSVSHQVTTGNAKE